MDHYASFDIGFIISIARSIKSCATGLSVRFFSAMMLTGDKGIWRSTGSTFSGTFVALKRRYTSP